MSAELLHEPITTGDLTDLADEVDRDAAAATDADLAEEELLVEEISIDGMCGVY
jgi:mycofactocin precursor